MDWAPRTVASGLGFPEGPVALDDGSIAFVDILDGRIRRARDGAVETVAEVPGGPNGAALGSGGALYVANNGGVCVGPDGYQFSAEQVTGRVQRVEPDGGVTDVAIEFAAPAPWRPNDLCFGPDGALYVTDPHNWEDLANLGPGRVWRIAPGGAPEQIAEVPLFPNGIGFGADGRTLYVAQSMTMSVLAFDWTPGGLAGERVLAKFAAGFPDGFCVTANGDLIVCGSMADVIHCVDQEGTPRWSVQTGDHTEPTNCCLADGVLYVTMSSARELVAVDCGLEALPLHRGAV
ncbi:MAG TPA: SMP-30/gluconolactonase/LRE family protein [Actinomycetota bacterium]